MPVLLRRVSAVALLLLAACADGGTSPSSGGGGGTRSVAEALTVDLAAVPNYTHPQWTVDFDSDVQQRINDPLGNPLTDRGALLGRVLFYDRHLSINQAIRCATCHKPARAFTDDQRFSPGFNGTDRTTFRTMSLLNVRFYAAGQAFWNRRAPSFEAQATMPIVHPVEMGFDSTHGGIDSLLTRLGTLGYYRELFTWVYGDSVITEARMQLALAQFVRSLMSYRSRFDDGWSAVYDIGQPDRGLSRPFPNFTAAENHGKQLFIISPASGGGGCASCHVPPTFALEPGSGSNGLDAGETRVFKSPSLRSVAIRAPYMHDGRFASLGTVVTHYVRGVKEGPALDSRLRGPAGGLQQLHLTLQDQADLVAFLKTLTDTTIARDPKFADPFRR